MKQQDLTIQNTLLNWLTGELIEKSICEKLSKEHWDQLKSWCKDHRLAPLIKHNEGFENLPDSQFKVFITQQTRHQAFRQMQVQRELIHLDKVFLENEIDYKILKGPALAFECYPKPDMRPMRDIDVIVPKQFAVKAFNLLLENGCSRIENYKGDAESKVEVDKHLAPILGITAKVSIEVHTRTFDEKDLPGKKDFSDYAEFWTKPNSIEIGNRLISSEDPTFLLVHLIFHSVYEHNFNNGPLILTDVFYLLQHHTIDWPLFHQLVKDMEIQNGIDLFFSFYQKYYFYPKEIQIKLIDNDALLKATESLIFAEFESRGLRAMAMRLQSTTQSSGKLKYWLHKLFPSKYAICGIYGVKPDSKWIYAFYARNWLRQLFIMAPKHISHLIQLKISNKTDLHDLELLSQQLNK